MPEHNYRDFEPFLSYRGSYQRIPTPGAAESVLNGHHAVLLSLCPTLDDRWPGALVFFCESGSNEGDFLFHDTAQSRLRELMQEELSSW